MELEGRGYGIIMGVTRLLLLGAILHQTDPKGPNISGGGVYVFCNAIRNNTDRTYGIVSERIHPSFALGEIHSRLACGHSSIHGLRTINP